MGGEEEVVLVEYRGADLFLYYYKSDHAFSSSMTDPRARIITPEDAHIQWRANSVNPQEVWPQRGTPPFTLAAVHYWRNKIDFDYVDIGANVGMGVIALAVFFRRCGLNTKVYAFEPGPVYDLLLRSVRINGVGDVVKCVRAAVAEHSGRAQFHVTPAQSPASSLLSGATVRPGVVTSYTIDVDLITFDEFARELRQAPGLLIKIDAEGVDFKVLDGMQRSLAERLVCFQIELYPALTDAYTDAVARLLDLTREYVLILSLIHI